MTLNIIKPRLAAALEARSEFLEEHPEYEEMQSKIELALAKAGNQNNRLNVIHKLMMESVTELSEKIGDLHSLLTKVTGK